MIRTPIAALLLVLPLADALPAQVPNGHLLVSAHSPNRIYVLDPDGDIVQQVPVFGRGVALSFAGHAVTIKKMEFLRFDLVGGEALAPVATTTLDDMDVAVFGDGTLVVVSPNDDVVRAIDPESGDIEWTVPFNTTVWCATVDADDHLWVGDVTPSLIHEIDRDGQLLQSLVVPWRVHDLARDPDGTFWVLDITARVVAHLAPDGTEISHFDVSASTAFAAGMTQALDGRIWITTYTDQRLLLFEQDGTLVREASLPSGIVLDVVTVRRPVSTIGTSYCGPANPNSTGSSAELAASGDPRASLGSVELRAVNMPPGQPGYFLVSETQGFVSLPPGSEGNLCLGGNIGRYSNDVFTVGSNGGTLFYPDLSAVPGPFGSSTVLPGETWNWQVWFRDANPNPTSNFTDGVAVTFL